VIPRAESGDGGARSPRVRISPVPLMPLRSGANGGPCRSGNGAVNAVSVLPLDSLQALGILAEKPVKIGGLSLFVTFCVLGCATSISHLEPREKTPHTIVSSHVEPRSTSPDAITSSDVEPIETAADSPPPIAIPDNRLSVFGTIETDADGRLAFLSANEIRNAENEMYGWRIWVGRTSKPVQWTERLTGPVGSEVNRGSQSTNSDDSQFAKSDDGRTATFTGAMVPDQGFIYSQWVLGADEAPGRYEIAVSLPGGRTETFSFALGQPQDACPSMRILLNWWRAKHSLEGDPENRDVTDRVMKVLGTRLSRHGFVVADLEDAYWYVMASAARRSDDREIAYGHIVMRAIADFQGKARRYSSTTSNFTGMVDYGILFDAPVGELDEFIRTLADKFAAVLTPHARQACSDWWSGQLAEEARLEEVRTQLEEEIIRVRKRRAEHEKRLELDVSP
jgi:hypothetical protein